MATSNRRAASVLAALVLAALAGALLWFLEGPADGTERAALLRTTDAEPAHDAPGDPELAGLRDAETERTGRRTEATERGGAPERAASADPAPSIELAVRVVAVDPTTGTDEAGRLDLRATLAPTGTGEAMRLAGNLDVLEFDGLRPLVYELRVAGDGLRPVVREIDLTAGSTLPCVVSEDTLRYTASVAMWREDLVPVVVRTSDGRPFDAYADDLGVPRQNLFVGVFDVVVRALPPDDDSWDEPSDDTVAIYTGPRVYKTWTVDTATIGTLEVRGKRPLWAGLRAFGEPVEWRVLAVGQERLEFTLGLDDVTSAFATLSLRVVDGPNGSPVPGARVVLKADSSAMRREEHTDARTDLEGRLELTRILPGEFEFTVEANDALHSDHLVLERGEHRDLGDIVLAPSLGIDVVFVDEEGGRVSGYLEVAPYRPGEEADVLYPDNLHRHSSEGEYHLPLPTEPSILRLRESRPPQGFPTGRRSVNVLVDPAAPPLRPIELVARSELAVTVDARAHDHARLEVRDPLDLVVGRVRELEDGRVRVDLPSGSYEVVLFDADGAELGRTAFELGAEPFELTVL
ncbi:MAG: carboxypeptidase-like regulatory domain-containing protein [Planctomycetota bacterium]